MTTSDLATPPLPTTILLLASSEYINNAAVLATVRSLPSDSLLLITSYRVGVGHVICTSTSVPAVRQIKWQPTRPMLPFKASRAILFWDGHDLSILRSLVVIKRNHIPVEIIDMDGNALDLPAFCARLTTGSGGRNQMTLATATVAAPTVIVDNPSKTKDTRIRIQLTLLAPEGTIEQYELQARAAGVSLEKILSDRLRTCVDHTSGRGLYFNDAQRSELERITGGHSINDATLALQKIRTVVALKVDDITIDLNERILARATSRAKSERKTLVEYMKKEVIQGLEKSVGLRPY